MCVEASGGGQIMQKHRPSQSLGDGCGLGPTCPLVSGLYRIKWIRILSRGQLPSSLLSPSSSFHELIVTQSQKSRTELSVRMFTAASNLSSQPSTMGWTLHVGNSPGCPMDAHSGGKWMQTSRHPTLAPMAPLDLCLAPS